MPAVSRAGGGFPRLLTLALHHTNVENDSEIDDSGIIASRQRRRTV